MLTSTIMMIHINLKHTGKIIAVRPHFGDTIPKTTTLNLSKLSPPEKYYFFFKQKGKFPGQHNIINQYH